VPGWHAGQCTWQGVRCCSGRQLSRNNPQRHVLLRNMNVSLLRHGMIKTALPKARKLRRVVAPLITLGRTGIGAKGPLAASRLRDAEVAEKLFDEIGARLHPRSGGYPASGAG
jgi:large subunit ribosomal protein L17